MGCGPSRGKEKWMNYPHEAFQKYTKMQRIGRGAFAEVCFTRLLPMLVACAR